MKHRFAALLLFVTAIASAQKLPYRPIITGLPYTAKTVTTLSFASTNGKPNNRQVTEWAARNSDGWEWYKRDINDGPSSRTFYIVWNPVDHTRTTWCSCTKVAQQRKFGNPAAEPKFLALPDPGSTVPYQRVALPPKTIAGFETAGVETTRMVRLDTDRTQTRKQVTQLYYSSELHLVMYRLTDDPNHGKQHFEVLKLKREEPDAKLFQIPRDRSIEAAADAEEQEFE